MRHIYAYQLKEKIITCAKFFVRLEQLNYEQLLVFIFLFLINKLLNYQIS